MPHKSGASCFLNSPILMCEVFVRLVWDLIFHYCHKLVWEVFTRSVWDLKFLLLPHTRSISIESQPKKVVVVVVVVVVVFVVVIIIGHKKLTLKFDQNRVNTSLG